MHHSSTSTYIPNVIEIKRKFFSRITTVVTAKFKDMTQKLGQQVAQLSLTNPRDVLHYDKRQNFKTVT